MRQYNTGVRQYISHSLPLKQERSKTWQDVFLQCFVMLCNIYISQNSPSVKTALSEQLYPEPRMGNSSEKVNILRPRILLDISPKNETKPLDQTTF